MKAIVFKKYGSPEAVLQVQEVEKPVPKEKEVLIRIYATAINDYDWSIVTGRPMVYRLMFGLMGPKNPIPGMELSGVVEQVGPGVEKFILGDAVFGDISDYGFGSFAEYISLNENGVMKKSDAISFETAAAVPHASLLALQALELGKISHGQRVLINGAGGGVGTFGVQLAKRYQCEVTGVDQGSKFELMKSIGFDKVIDYTKENFTKNGIQYDLILDCKSNQSPSAYMRALKPKGHYVTIGGKINSLLSVLFYGKTLARFSSKKLRVLALKANEGLAEINRLLEEKVLSSVIDGPYMLEEIPRLISLFGAGKHKGKIIVSVAQ